MPGAACTAARFMLMQCTSSPFSRSICSGRTIGPPRFEPPFPEVFSASRTSASSWLVLAVTYVEHRSINIACTRETRTAVSASREQGGSSQSTIQWWRRLQNGLRQRRSHNRDTSAAAR